MNTKRTIVEGIILIIILLIAYFIPFIFGTVYHISSQPDYASLPFSISFLVLFGILLYFCKLGLRDLKTIFVSLIYIVYVFSFGEYLGWYFKLWDYLPNETNDFVVLYHSTNESLTFACVMTFIGFFYIIFSRMNKHQFYYYSIIMIGFNVILGWSVDVYLNHFNTYVTTFFVWFFMEFGFWLYYVGYAKDQRKV